MPYIPQSKRQTTGRVESRLVGRTIRRRRLFIEVVCGCGRISWVDKNQYQKCGKKSTSCFECYHKMRTPANKTHGHCPYGRPTTEYSTWQAMKRRCLNPNDPAYGYYGGRGITVCKKWLRFEGFLQDMGCKPNRKLTLERLDFNKGYCKSNCVWADRKTQAANKRKTIRRDSLMQLIESCKTIKELKEKLRRF